MDGDGWTDLYLCGLEGSNALYRNLRGNSNNWLQVDLQGVKSNRMAIGAKLTAKVGGATIYREVKGSEGFGATNPYRQQLGLGKADTVDSLTIEWPTGRKQVLRAVKANQRISVREGSAQ